MVKYIDSVKLAFSDWGKLGIGLLVSIIPIVNWMIHGYGFRLAKSAMHKKTSKTSKKVSAPALPEWESWWDLFVKGFFIIVISLIYMLPGIVLLIAALIPILTSAVALTAVTDAYMEELITSAIAANSGMFIAGALLIFIGLYFSGMAIMNYVAKEKFSAAFEFDVIIRKTLTSTYLVSILFIIGVAIAIALPLSIISELLAFTIVLPIIIDAFVSIVLTIISSAILGQVYAETK